MSEEILEKAVETKEESAETTSENGEKAEKTEKTEKTNDEQELLNIRIPTQTKKSQKRKHIRTDFGSADLDESVLEAQRLEKERLDRLEKAKPQNDHIQQIESLFLGGNGGGALPQLDISNQDFDDDFDFLHFENDNDTKRYRRDMEEQKPNSLFDDFEPLEQKPSTSKGPVDFVDLTEDSDDDCMITDVRTVPQQAPRRMRWAQAEKDRVDVDQMELQHNIEAQRMKKARSAKDLESTEKCGGRLLVNSGHPAEDPDIFVISHLTHILQPHQLGGIRFMYDNTIESIGEYKNSPGFGCILAHSMGLGKTIQVITFSEIFLRATKSKKILIIVPINTIQNWYAEYDKWIPKFSDVGDRIRSFEVFLLGDSVKTFDQRVNLIEQWDQKGGILLIGYDMFRTLIKTTQPKKEKKGRPKLNLSGVSSGLAKELEEQKKEDEMEFETGFTNGGRVRQEAYDLLRRALLDPGPDLVVCDEGHKIKNITAEISLTLGAINTKRRIVLTGYPLQNNLMEYFCMIDFVRPKYLGTRKSFVERFEKPIKNGQCVDSTPGDLKTAMQRTHVLVELVKGFVQRRTHHLLKKILPESKEYVLLLRKSHIQRQLYRNFVLYARNELDQGNDSVFNPLMAFSACSKFWNHPDILYRLVEQKKKQEAANEEKKRQAEMRMQIQQQQQQGMMMYNGGMMGQMGQMNSMSSMNPMTFGNPQFYGQQPQTSNGMINGGMMVPHNGWSNNYNMPQSPFSTPSNPSTPSTPSSKKTRKGRGAAKKTKSDEDEEEGEKEGKMRYDWTYELFEKYQQGILENGYKLLIAMEILNETTKQGEKILIFSQNLAALDMIEELLARRTVVGKDGPGQRWEKNRNYLRLDGTTSGAEREKLINRFNSEAGLHLFLISTRAGSLGINLVSANRCIIVDACWNPCHDAQAVCRVYRYGQQKKTFVYRLIMDNSMERAIFNRQISKHGLQQRVVDDAQVDANISQKELETLLMYDEALDVVNDKWDTTDWDLGDSILESITEKFSHLLSEKPFLHESLIMESEKTLSEEEKREAQLLFEQEKRMENYDPANPGMSSSSMLNNPNPMPYSNGMNGMNGGPIMPMYNNQWQQPQPPPYMQQQQPLPYQARPSPMPHILRMNTGQFHGGHTMTSYNNAYNNNNNPAMQQQMLPPRDPSAFHGALRSWPPKYTKAGAVQQIITDRALCFKHIGEKSHILQAVPANTEVQLIAPRQGHYVKLADGTILDAMGSIFESRVLQLRFDADAYHQQEEQVVIDLD